MSGQNEKSKCAGSAFRSDRLTRMINDNKILIAAHRGTKGGGIVENTCAAFDCALMNGANILELDVVRSSDGVLYVFHDGNEKRLLGTDGEKNIKEMTSAEIDAYFYRNSYGKKTGYKVERFADVLRRYRGGPLINVDRCWDIFDDVIAEVRNCDMFDQVIFKCPPGAPGMAVLDKVPENVMYMTMVSSPEELDTALRSSPVPMALEINFTDEGTPIVSHETLADLKARGLLLWTNALSLKEGWTASAYHDDNLAITESQEKGWGWLLDRGFDIIQTDWPMLLRRYVNTHRFEKSQANDDQTPLEVPKG